MVQHDPHPVRLWVPLLHQPLHVVGEGRHGPVRGHGNLPPPGVRCTAHQPIAGAMALVCLVRERGLARVGGQWHPGRRKPLRARVSAGDLGTRRLRRCLIAVQPVLPGRDQLGPPRGHAPGLFVPGRERVFLRTWRTGSRAMDGAQPHSTTVSASSRRVPWACPAGAGVHATASRGAAGLSVRWRWAPGRDASARAPKPVATNRWRGRAPGAVPPSNAVAMASSSQPSAALSRRRARVSWRAPVVPLRSRCSNVARWSGRRSTTYLFLGLSGPSSYGWSPDCT
jgi:hypothetical protein